MGMTAAQLRALKLASTGAALGAGARALQPDDAEAAPRMTAEELRALRKTIKTQTVNDNRTDDLQSLRASLGVPKGPDLRVVSGTAAGLAPGAADAFNRNLDASLDLASFFDPSMGYATETARALKDLPGKVGGAGTLALAPVVGATNMLGGIGQLPEMAGAGLAAVKRAMKQMQADEAMRASQPEIYGQPGLVVRALAAGKRKPPAVSDRGLRYAFLTHS